MRYLIVSVLLCCVVVAPVAAETSDSIQPTNANLIALCAAKSDFVAHVKVSSKAFVRKPPAAAVVDPKPTEPIIVDLWVYGELTTLDVKHVYLREDVTCNFPANIYLYRRGALHVSFLEPSLQVGQQYLVFLKEGKAPELVNSGVVTDPQLPATNYFTFVRLPQRQVPNCKAYVKIADTNALASVEKCLSESLAPRRYKDKQPQDR